MCAATSRSHRASLNFREADGPGRESKERTFLVHPPDRLRERNVFGKHCGESRQPFVFQQRLPTYESRWPSPEGVANWSKMFTGYALQVTGPTSTWADK